MKLMYEIGDMVKIVNDIYGSGYHIGTTGEIIDMDTAEGSTWYKVALDPEKVRVCKALSFLAIELEAIE